MSERSLWPIHPQPLKGESLESWVIRQANANCIPADDFAVSYIGSSLKKDFDFLEEGTEHFEIIASCVTGGRARTFQMTFFSLITELEPRKRNLSSWVTPVKGGRSYCPLCFSEDETPHLRLTWRLIFAPVCIKHKALLHSKCSNTSCLAPIQPWLPNPYYDFKNCQRCGSLLSNSQVQLVDPTELGYTAVSHFLKLLKGTEDPSAIGWKYDMVELFRTIKFLSKFISKVTNAKVTSSSSFSLVRNNRSEPDNIYYLLGDIWSLLQEWPENVGSFIGNNRLVFKKLISQSACPKPIEDYLSFMQIGRPSRKAYVNHKIKADIVKLRLGGYSKLRIAKVLGLPRSTVVYHTQKLRKEIRYLRRRLRKRPAMSADLLPLIGL